MAKSIITRISVDEELKDTNVLRRYLDLAMFLKFIECKKLYLCRADLFQDKFEGSFTPSLKQAIEFAYKDNRIDFTYDKFRKKLRERVFINCWAKGADDNMAMWSLYGRSDSALAITTTVGQLRETLKKTKNLGNFMVRKVRYIKHWKDPKIDIKPYSNIFSYKNAAFSYENEVRVILDRFHKTFDSDIEEGLELEVIPSKFLRSIVVSPTAPRWFYDLIKDITAKYSIPSPVRHSKLAMKPI